MKDFAVLLEKLILTPSRNKKIEALAAYFTSTPDPERGYVLAAITRDLTLKNLKAATLKKIAMSRVDPVLFALSYDYVGDMAETISLIWPDRKQGDLPALSGFLELIDTTPKTKLPEKVAMLLDIATPGQRFALIKLVTGGLRAGVSARLAKTALAHYSGRDLSEIERLWHGLTPPYVDFFEWLDGKRAKPEIDTSFIFHPMMLAHPVDENKDFDILMPSDFQAEWKWDGVRVQLALTKEGVRLFSRTGDEMSSAFPDLSQGLKGVAVLDGELLVGHDFKALPFNYLQQRLNRKKAVAQHLTDYPAFVRVYDILFENGQDLRQKTLQQRRTKLEQWMQDNANERLCLSEELDFKTWEELAALRKEGAEKHGHEGLMIKKLDSLYKEGRPKGLWFKWKRDVRLVDAVIMYAQRGHGKRSSFYSDFTFGVWKGNEIVPIGKAYSGFTDEELRRLDSFVRKNTVARFGPVREVRKELVVEIAFDSAHESPRHKSGVALRFPRFHRIRWDKPAQEVQTLQDFKAQFL